MLNKNRKEKHLLQNIKKSNNLINKPKIEGSLERADQVK